jgi:hypothetical protein
MEEAMPETEGDAVGVKVRGCVVTEELGVAEDEAGLVIVIGVPGGQREDWCEQTWEPNGVESTQGGFVANADEKDCFPKREGCGRYDGGLFGEGGEGEHECR